MAKGWTEGGEASAARLVVVERLAHRGGDGELDVAADEELLDGVEHPAQPVGQLQRGVLQLRVRAARAARGGGRARGRGGVRGGGSVAAPLEEEEDEADRLRVQLLDLARRRGGLGCGMRVCGARGAEVWDACVWWWW